MNKIRNSPFRHPWWSPFTSDSVSPKCLDEWAIIELSSLIREKPNWEEKYKDSDILRKWKSEYAQLAVESKHKDAIFDYTLKELGWYEQMQKSVSGRFRFGPDDRILFSDDAISKELKLRFAEDAANFEKVTPKDYHPGSDDMVVDLVHPSLFHLQYGKTKEIVDGNLVVAEYSKDIAAFKPQVSDFGISKNFQWLPALMRNDTGRFRFASYINNLHPIEHEVLYRAIEDVFNAVLPGLDLTLSRFVSPIYTRVPIPEYDDVYGEGFGEYEERLEELYEEEYDPEKEAALMEEKVNYLKEFPPKWENGPETTRFSLGDFQNIKVIVKMANIELTPDKPEYKGGSWHVEGTINEDIVATVLYYYDMDNIKDSRLSFRVAFGDPSYTQGDDLYCSHYFGINDEQKMTRVLGSVAAKQDRVVIFPNALQHHVDAFELADRLKPGFRKILCFFIVDPHNKLVRASNMVPPQQKLWVECKELMSKYFGSIDPESVVTMTREEALQKRLELMAERSVEEDVDDWDNCYVRLFSLCEH